jgi:hypothetical protein
LMMSRAIIEHLVPTTGTRIFFKLFQHDRYRVYADAR